MAFGTDESDGPVAAINVTPLVDVMLVLLVIFMVTAPMLQQGVEVNLPKATTAPLTGSAEQIVVSIDEEGKIFIGSGNQIELSEVGTKLKAVLEAKAGAGNKVYIKGDTNLNYGRVMEVMGRLYDAGIYEIGLVSAPLDSAEVKKRK
jgi:biopolymer transport protein TolR